MMPPLRWVLDPRLYTRSLELLFDQSTSAFISSAIAGLVLVITFWSESDPAVSALWVGGYASVACYRLYLRKAFRQCSVELRASPLWFSKMALGVFLTGTLWGVFLLYLASYADEGILAAILMANMAFLMAGAVTAYAISLPIFLLFSAPIVLPAVAYLALSLDETRWLLASIALGWYLFMISTARRFGEFAMRALGYEYENMALVYELEEQNRRAEVLVEELIVLSNTDALTGVFNRRYFDERIAREFKCVLAREGGGVSLVLCDVDYFKAYNDTLGHVEGDHCLQQVADILSASVREKTDIVARYGGEEFALIFPETSRDQAKIYAERLRRALATRGLPHPSSPIKPYVTVSMGLATVVPDGHGPKSVEELISRADAALYRAKREGRDRLCVE